LERQSSSGSTRSTTLQPRRRVPSTRQSTRYTTADGSSLAWGTAVTSKYATGAEGTIYETAQESTYTAAPSYHTRSTYMTTATGTQE
jgi:hypothetical protein